MNSTITCPHCGKLFEITDAITHELESAAIKKQQEKHQKELDAVKEDIQKKVMGEVVLLREENAKKQKELEEARTIELTLRKEKNKLDDERRAFEVEKQRQLDAEREKIRQKTLEEAADKQRLKDKEKDMLIEGLKKSLDDAQRKASQGSQQMQGEVSELDLEITLRQTFLFDTIEPVGKGIRGADVRQIVKTKMGNICGVILWESKQTKAWANEWIGKLKEDLLREKANISIIVSTQLPEEAKSGFGFKDGVCVISPLFILPIADIMRQRLIEQAREKFISQNKGEKADDLYAFMTSHEFRQQIEALAEVYHDMQDQVAKERMAFEKIWKTRETQIVKMVENTARIVGSVRGIIGQSLPSIKGLDLLEESDMEQREESN